MSDENEPKPAAPSKNQAPPSLLSKPTDAAVRPGFRTPPTNKSKVQQKKK